jgi:hypothetical protein
MVCCPFRLRVMMVTRGMLGEPARRGGALAGLGLAGSLPCLPVSLGRDRVKERHADEMIRHGRFGLTAPPSPARGGLRSGVGIPLADSLPVRLGLVHVVGYLLRDVRSQ